jgi:hypothetical protein
MSNFAQSEKESLSQAWGRFCALKRRCPAHGFKENDLLDIIYNALTEKSRSYLDSVVGNVFKHMTIEDAKGLLDTVT